jgi:hypothetical protein
MSNHARLAPSASHRWINCTASVDAAARYADPPGEAAMEGTAAHWLLEQCLTTGKNPVDFLGRAIRVRQDHVEREFVVDKDMANDVALGVDYMREVVSVPGWSGVETRADLGFFEPGMFGTCDIWHVRQDRWLTLVDFKYGHGDVSPIGNTQLLLYVCGILNHVQTIVPPEHFPTRLHLVVIQPRSVIPGPRIKTWDVPVGYLEPFVARVQDAITEINRFPTFKSGSWCRHCPALGECPATEAEAQALAPSLLTVDMTVGDAARILQRKDLLEKIVKKAEACLADALTRGQVVPGFKLVTGVKHRQWRDENLAKQRLAEAFGADCLKAPTPSAAEKLGKEAKAIVADLAFTPKGEAVVGREDDKRAPFIAKTVETMFGPSK